MTDDPMDMKDLEKLLHEKCVEALADDAQVAFTAILDRGQVRLDAYLTEHGLPPVEALPAPDEMSEADKETVYEGWVLILEYMSQEIKDMPNTLLRMVVAQLLRNTLLEMFRMGMGDASANEALQVRLSAMMGGVGES